MDSLENKKSFWKKLKADLRFPFLLNIIEKDTYRQRVQRIITPGGILLILSGIFFLFVGLAWVIVAYTPLRLSIPGYNDPEIIEKYERIQQYMQKSERTIAERDSMIQNMQRLFDILKPDSGQTEIPKKQLIPIENNPKRNKKRYVPPTLPQMSDMNMMPDSLSMALNNPIKPITYEGTGLAGSLVLMRPVEGILTNKFNSEENHFAIDLVASENSLIRSVADGYVLYAEYSIQTGYVIAIQHKNQLISFYKHNSRLLKTLGSYVRAGEAIAVIGNSGEHSTGPHLHFEIWQGGIPLNPTDYLSYIEK